MDWNRTPRMRPTHDQLAALKALWEKANEANPHGQVIASFLLSLHMPLRYAFNLNELKVVDAKTFSECLTVLDLETGDALCALHARTQDELEAKAALFDIRPAIQRPHSRRDNDAFATPRTGTRA